MLAHQLSPPLGEGRWMELGNKNMEKEEADYLTPASMIDSDQRRK